MRAPTANNMTTGAAAYTGMTTVDGGASGKLVSSCDTFTISAPKAVHSSPTRRSSDLMSTVAGGGTGTLKSSNDTWTISSANSGNLTTNTVAFTGMSTLTDMGRAHV